MSGQHCENYDVKREIVYCYPRNFDCCSVHMVRGGLMLSLESQSVFQNLLFVLFCYLTNHLMTGPLENSEFCFPRMSLFPETNLNVSLDFVSGNIEILGKQNSLFPLGTSH